MRRSPHALSAALRVRMGIILCADIKARHVKRASAGLMLVRTRLMALIEVDSAQLKMNAR